jgi:hypothetical protein
MQRERERERGRYEHGRYTVDTDKRVQNYCETVHIYVLKQCIYMYMYMYTYIYGYISQPIEQEGLHGYGKTVRENTQRQDA